MNQLQRLRFSNLNIKIKSSVVQRNNFQTTASIAKRCANITFETLQIISLSMPTINFDVAPSLTRSRRNEAVELFRQARDFSAFSFSLGRQRDRKTILEKGAWSRRLVTVCSMKYERGNLIKTFSTRFAWTLTRRLLTQRRQGEFCLLAVWRNIRNWTFFSRFMAMTCKRTTKL